VHLKRMILVRPSSAQKGAAFRAITLGDAATLG
jgi:trehalose-6-phosphatase